MFLLYRAITWLALAASPAYALVAFLRRPGRWRDVAERFGFLPGELLRMARGGVWLQASSVGELQLARQLVGELSRVRPDLPMVLSVTTPAARRILDSGLRGTVGQFTFPLDLPPVVARAVATLQPSIFIAVETEIWPNLYADLRRRGVPVVLVNGRISDRTLPRYRRWAGLFRRAFAAIRLVCARSEEDARRFVTLGVPAARVQTTGNLKFDCRAPGVADVPDALRSLLEDRLVLVAASTHTGEEEAALSAARRALVNGGRPITVVLAPRHASRLNEVAAWLDQAGLPWVRRTALGAEGRLAEPGGALQVILLDTHGELPSIYALADVALLGGTLVPVGGHNPLEAAAGGVPSVSGPHLRNLQDTADVLIAAGGLLPARDREEAITLLARLLSDAGERRLRGESARRAVALHAGATARTLDLLRPLLRPARP